MIDETHDPKAGSWVPGADAHPDFPVQNLPLGIYSTAGGAPRPGVAIGDHVLDLGGAAPLLDDEAARHTAAAAVAAPRLNELLEHAPEVRRALRRSLFRLLSDPSREPGARALLRHASECTMHLPVEVRDYTDFYAGIHHARAVGALLRPENPLLPNYKYVPVGYHGRASSIRPSGGKVVRPRGQVRRGEAEPQISPSTRLDYEVELGLWIGGRSTLGEPIPIAAARDHLAGVCLLNDWSARDIQAWEYQPLGPFLAKNFATTVSPWIVTADALAPFRVGQQPRPAGDPSPLPYLLDEADQRSGAFDVRIEVSVRSRRMGAEGLPPHRLGRTNALHLYWTPGQLIAHHSVNGCDLAAGDLLGTGTISGPDDDSRGSLMELSRGGRQPIMLPGGETRTFLEDGDELTLTGWAERDGYRRIGLGACTATIAPAIA